MLHWNTFVPQEYVLVLPIPFPSLGLHTTNSLFSCEQVNYLCTFAGDVRDTSHVTENLYTLSKPERA